MPICTTGILAELSILQHEYLAHPSRKDRALPRRGTKVRNTKIFTFPVVQTPLLAPRCVALLTVVFALIDSGLPETPGHSKDFLVYGYQCRFN